MTFGETLIVLAIVFCGAVIISVVREEIEARRLIKRNHTSSKEKKQFTKVMQAVKEGRAKGAMPHNRKVARTPQQMRDLGLVRKAETFASRPIQYEEMAIEPPHWESIQTPEHRPGGKWVNWKFRSGWMKVKGTNSYADDITDFLLLLDDLSPETDKLRIYLERDPYNAYDPNAIEVTAIITGNISGEFMLGFVEADAAQWLAETYSSDMPIAATIAKLRTNYEYTSITICGLMPAKKERDHYLLGKE